MKNFLASGGGISAKMKSDPLSSWEKYLPGVRGWKTPGFATRTD